MNPHYNQNYTRKEIDAVLAKIKACVERNRYTISLNENRQENIDFINEYNIRSDKQKSDMNMKFFMSLFRKYSFLTQMVKKKLLMFTPNLI